MGVEVGSGSGVGRAGTVVADRKSWAGVAIAVAAGCSRRLASSGASPQAATARLIEMTNASKGAVSLVELSISDPDLREKYASAAVQPASKASRIVKLIDYNVWVWEWLFLRRK